MTPTPTAPKAPSTDGQATPSISAFGKARSTVSGTPLSADELGKMDGFWRASNYLALGMTYLKANPLLKEQLQPEHVKDRLLGHWGTSPGLAFAYIHMSRAIKQLRPRWPMIVLRTPKGWTSRSDVGGHKLEGSWRAHQVPMADVKKDPARLKQLEDWMRGYKPQELFDEKRVFKPELMSSALRAEDTGCIT